jgi:hypothetical protein
MYKVIELGPALPPCWPDLNPTAENFYAWPPPWDAGGAADFFSNDLFPVSARPMRETTAAFRSFGAARAGSPHIQSCCAQSMLSICAERRLSSPRLGLSGGPTSSIS